MEDSELCFKKAVDLFSESVSKTLKEDPKVMLGLLEDIGRLTSLEDIGRLTRKCQGWLRDAAKRRLEKKEAEVMRKEKVFEWASGLFSKLLPLKLERKGGAICKKLHRKSWGLCRGGLKSLVHALERLNLDPTNEEKISETLNTFYEWKRDNPKEFLNYNGADVQVVLLNLGEGYIQLKKYIENLGSKKKIKGNFGYERLSFIQEEVPMNPVLEKALKAVPEEYICAKKSFCHRKKEKEVIKAYLETLGSDGNLTHITAKEIISQKKND